MGSIIHFITDILSFNHQLLCSFGSGATKLFNEVSDSVNYFVVFLYNASVLYQRFCVALVETLLIIPYFLATTLSDMLQTARSGIHAVALLVHSTILGVISLVSWFVRTAFFLFTLPIRMLYFCSRKTIETVAALIFRSIHTILVTVRILPRRELIGAKGPQYETMDYVAVGVTLLLIAGTLFYFRWVIARFIYRISIRLVRRGLRFLRYLSRKFWRHFGTMIEASLIVSMPWLRIPLCIIRIVYRPCMSLIMMIAKYIGIVRCEEEIRTRPSNRDERRERVIEDLAAGEQWSPIRDRWDFHRPESAQSSPRRRNNNNSNNNSRVNSPNDTFDPDLSPLNRVPLRSNSSNNNSSTLDESGNNLDDSERLLCVVCQDSERSVVLLPCHHCCCCKPCAEALTRRIDGSCPMCRRPITSLLDIFL